MSDDVEIRLAEALEALTKRLDVIASLCVESPQDRRKRLVEEYTGRFETALIAKDHTTDGAATRAIRLADIVIKLTDEPEK